VSDPEPFLKADKLNKFQMELKNDVDSKPRFMKDGQLLIKKL